DQTIVEVSGHTDNVGTAAVNQRISEERARNVADYLIGQGLRRERFEVAGFGYQYPVADNSTEQGRALNRRVEIRIVPLRSGPDPPVADRAGPRRRPCLSRWPPTSLRSDGFGGGDGRRIRRRCVTDRTGSSRSRPWPDRTRGKARLRGPFRSEDGGGAAARAKRPLKVRDTGVPAS